MTTPPATSASAADDHRRRAGRGPVTVALVTISDTRTPDTDVNGAFLRDRLAADGHHVAAMHIIPDEPDQVAALLHTLTTMPGVQLVLFNGGTGIAPRDTTYDVVVRKLDKPLPGFGELFRMLSYAQVGAAAMLSRAEAGVVNGTLVFCMPGSPQAVQLAFETLIAPELQHLAWELTRKGG